MIYFLVFIINIRVLLWSKNDPRFYIGPWFYSVSADRLMAKLEHRG